MFCTEAEEKHTLLSPMLSYFDNIALSILYSYGLLWTSVSFECIHRTYHINVIIIIIIMLNVTH